MNTSIQGLVCYCNSTWNSILPPPPCPYHSPAATEVAPVVVIVPVPVYVYPPLAPTPRITVTS